MLVRIFATLSLLVMAAAWPFWLTAAVMLLFVFFFKGYYEAFAVGIFIDMLYGRPILGFAFCVSLAALAAIFAAERIKRQLFI